MTKFNPVSSSLPSFPSVAAPLLCVYSQFPSAHVRLMRARILACSSGSGLRFRGGITSSGFASFSTAAAGLLRAGLILAVCVLDSELPGFLLALFLRHFQRHDFTFFQALLYFGVEEIRDADLHITFLEPVFLLDIDEPFHLSVIGVLFGEYGGERNGRYIVRRGDRDFDVRRHTRSDARVHVFEKD